MQIFTSLLPLFIITALATYLRQHFSALPESLIVALHYLPHLLLLFGLIIAVHFNQLKVVSFTLILMILYVVSEQQWLDSSIKFALFSTFAPLLLWLISLIRESNVFSIKALPTYILIAVTVLLSLWLIREQPNWLDQYLLTTWLPFNTTALSRLNDTALLIFCIIFIALLIRLCFQPHHKSATAIAVLLTLFMSLNFSLTAQDFIIVISAGVLLCIFCVLQESWKMAYLDELTQLPGRRALQQKMGSIVGLYSIAMIDIDFFKKFNDKYGHDTGDLALQKVATTLKKIHGGSAYRYGGEEFTIIFTNKSTDQVKDELERIRQLLDDNPFQLPKHAIKNNQKPNVPLTISIGLADSIGTNSTGTVIKQADQALYQAKKKGRNRIAVSR